MLRVMRMAKDQGIEAYSSPTGSSPSDTTAGGRIETTVHELGALLVYGLSGTAGESTEPANEALVRQLPAAMPGSAAATASPRPAATAAPAP
jgi:hypothetical protein